MTVDTSVVGKANMNKNKMVPPRHPNTRSGTRERREFFICLSFALRHSFCFFATVTSDKSKG